MKFNTHFCPIVLGLALGHAAFAGGGKAGPSQTADQIADKLDYAQGIIVSRRTGTTIGSSNMEMSARIYRGSDLNGPEEISSAWGTSERWSHDSFQFEKGTGQTAATIPVFCRVHPSEYYHRHVRNSTGGHHRGGYNQQYPGSKIPSGKVGQSAPVDYGPTTGKKTEVGHVPAGKVGQSTPVDYRPATGKKTRVGQAPEATVPSQWPAPRYSKGKQGPTQSPHQSGSNYEYKEYRKNHVTYVQGPRQHKKDNIFRAGHGPLARWKFCFDSQAGKGGKTGSTTQQKVRPVFQTPTQSYKYGEPICRDFRDGTTKCYYPSTN